MTNKLKESVKCLRCILNSTKMTQCSIPRHLIKECIFMKRELISLVYPIPSVKPDNTAGRSRCSDLSTRVNNNYWSSRLNTLPLLLGLYCGEGRNCQYHYLGTAHVRCQVEYCLIQTLKEKINMFFSLS